MMIPVDENELDFATMWEFPQNHGIGNCRAKFEIGEAGAEKG